MPDDAKNTVSVLLIYQNLVRIKVNLVCLWYNKQKAGILRRKLYESAGIIISIAR